MYLHLVFSKISIETLFCQFRILAWSSTYNWVLWLQVTPSLTLRLCYRAMTRVLRCLSHVRTERRASRPRLSTPITAYVRRASPERAVTSTWTTARATPASTSRSVWTASTLTAASALQVGVLNWLVFYGIGKFTISHWTTDPDQQYGWSPNNLLLTWSLCPIMN